MSGFGGDLDVAVGSVVGVRTWLYNSDIQELVGLFGIRWRPSKGKYTAKCHSPFGTDSIIPPHDTPPSFEFPCGCGFYAFWKSELHRVEGTDIVAGVIEGTGRTLIGGLGFRSQYAQIKGLTVEATDDGVKEILKDKYGVPVYDGIQELLQAHPTTQDYYREPEVVKVIPPATLTAQIKIIDAWKKLLWHQRRSSS